MSVTVVQPGIVNGGQSEGAKRPSGGEGVKGGGGGPLQGREIFEDSCMMENGTLNAIIRGSLCNGIDQFPFSFLSFFTRRSTWGGGGMHMAPCAPLIYASDCVDWN